MIFPLAGIVLGVVIGVFRARARGGKPADMAQWGAAYGILFGLIGLFLLIFIERSYL